MGRKWLTSLGFVGILGLLGLITKEPQFFYFFSFFTFFLFSKIKDDERLGANINKASRNAFFSSVLFFALILIYAVLFRNITGVVIAFGLSFCLQFLIFTISFLYYDQR
ncbi:MAG TPA: DUF3796 domain-containing protein [Bacillota bacterium]|nr:DUF3796 domain-containing protein [Bacillota bacterium]